MIVQWLKSWINAIVSIVLLSTFVEIVLPTSQIRKYIQFIIGLMVVLAVLAPLVKLLGQGDAAINDMNSLAFDVPSPDLEQQQAIQEQQTHSAIELYKQGLQQSIQQQISAMGYGNVAEVKVSVDEEQNSKAFGSIKAIDIYMDEVQPDSIQPVKPVSIDVSSDKAVESQQAIPASDAQAQALKKQLASYYQISPDAISIYRK